MKVAAAALCAIVCISSAAHAQTSYAHFEARHVHPIGLTPDGSRLLALNTPDARLSVFNVTNTANATPVLEAEIPVGYEPVSLRARTNDEVWVVSELSDSVSIVSLSQRAVVATLRTPDEPADVVFANGKAFVTCARSATVRVFEAASRTDLGTITLTGNYPRALAASADGTKVYVAFQLSGNRTTTLPYSLDRFQPAPTNTALPEAPKVALIVPTTDSRVSYTVLDNDIAEINTASLTVTRYLSDMGTNLFDIATHPSTGELWTANTEALNLVRFEPVLKGHFADHRLTKVSLPGTSVASYDLNPGVSYAVLPNAAAQAIALVQPTALVFSTDGSHGWVAAFNSDRVAKFSNAGAILGRVDMRPSGIGARGMRGPRGLALSADGSRLFVLNKLSNTVGVVDTAAMSVLAETAAGSRDPMPASIKEGRGFLFDARLSGNGLSSCAVCHLDADRDGIAWDLGDPGGSLVTVIGYNNSIHETTPRDRTMHPMKGPMVTQTLRGLQSGQLLHWRGDRPSIQSFNVTYRDLLGGDLPTGSDMDALAAYLLSLRHHPNPYRTLNRALPATFAGGNPTNGHAMFINHVKSHCNVCHTLPTGSDNNIDLNTIIGSSQPVKTVSLRTAYQRSNYSRNAGSVNISGYGLLKDGTGNELAIGHFYDLEDLSTLQEYYDINAYVQCFDTGIAPAVGYNVTVDVTNRNDATIAANLAIMEAQAALATPCCNLVVRGVIAGRPRYFSYATPAANYVSDNTSEAPQSRSALLNALTGADALTFMGVLAGSGNTFSIDRDTDTVANTQEPLPALTTAATGVTVRLSWPSTAPDWVLESSTTLQGPWQTVTAPRTSDVGSTRVEETLGTQDKRFYRLRRTW
ncbi:MAG: beta-propeller fold lactonase family protein [Roseimicrobium sp.]